MLTGDLSQTSKNDYFNCSAVRSDIVSVGLP